MPPGHRLVAQAVQHPRDRVDRPAPTPREGDDVGDSGTGGAACGSTSGLHVDGLSPHHPERYGRQMNGPRSARNTKMTPE
jgi:hypothetical protein